MPPLLPRQFAALLALCFLALPAAAAGPLGAWSTDGDKSRVLIEPCGDALCGRLVWLREPVYADGQAKVDRNNPDEGLRARPILGLPLLAGFKPEAGAPGRWTDGTIYDPESGKTYSGTLTLQPDGTLGVRGYVGLPMFGRSVLWTRAP